MPGQRGRDQGAGQHAAGHVRPAQAGRARPAPLLGKDFVGRAAQDRARHLRLVFHVGAQQGAVAQQVDAARHAVAQRMDLRHQACRERRLRRAAGHGQAVVDVAGRLVGRQRPQVIAGDHALRQLLQFGPGQHGAQFRLADEDDLQQLALARFQVGQQAQLFQHGGGQVLRFINDQHIVLALRMAGQQVRIDGIDIAFHAGNIWRHGDAELLADRQQQFLDGQFRIENVGKLAIVRDLLHEAAAHGGLAGADFPRQQHETAAAAHAVQQMRERLTVALAHEQVAGIGSDRKR